MATTIDRAIKHLKENDATAYPSTSHSLAGDHVSVFLTDEFFRTERVDEILTVHYGLKSSDIVGCRINDISILAEHVANIIEIKDNDVELKLLLLSATGTRKVNQHYYDLCKHLENIKVCIPQAA